MSAMSVLRCDREGCDRKYMKAGMTPHLRQSAEVEGGWRTDETGDWCPWHIPAIEADDEFEIAA